MSADHLHDWNTAGVVKLEVGKSLVYCKVHGCVVTRFITQGELEKDRRALRDARQTAVIEQ